MTILSIQSAVAYGHVGNSAAQLVLNRLGFEVWPLPTVLFSNHPGHGRHRGWVTPAEGLDALVQGLAELDLLRHCRALLSGYLGDPSQGRSVMAAWTRLRAANPEALWLCDPVIGDDGRIFVRPGVPEHLADEAVPAADVLTPNAFELAHFTGLEPHTTAAAVAAARQLAAAGHRPQRRVVATGLRLADAPLGTLAVVAVEGARAWRIATPDLGGRWAGAGDTFAALLLGKLLSGRRLASAAAEATSAIHALIAATRAAGERELRLVTAQRAWLRPQPRFKAERVA